MELFLEGTVINILNCSNNNYITLDEIKFFDETSENFIKNKINKCMACQDSRITSLETSSDYTDIIKRYFSDLISLKEFSDELGKIIFDYKMQSGTFIDSNLLISRFVADNIPYLIILDMSLTKNYIANYDINYSVISISNGLQERIRKDDNFCIIDCLNNILYIKENRIEINGEKKYLLADLIFHTSLPLNDKETCKVLNDTVKKVSQKYDESITNTIPELKSIISETSEPLMIDDLAEVFTSSDAKEEFTQIVKDLGLPEKIDIDKSRLTKREKTQKFITETGIEITIPATYVKRKDKVEIINNPDGTCSINIKNITHLKNRN